MNSAGRTKQRLYGIEYRASYLRKIGGDQREQRHARKQGQMRDERGIPGDLARLATRGIAEYRVAFHIDEDPYRHNHHRQQKEPGKARQQAVWLERIKASHHEKDQGVNCKNGDQRANHGDAPAQRPNDFQRNELRSRSRPRDPLCVGPSGVVQRFRRPRYAVAEAVTSFKLIVRCQPLQSTETDNELKRSDSLGYGVSWATTCSRL